MSLLFFLTLLTSSVQPPLTGHRMGEVNWTEHDNAVSTKDTV